MIWCWWASGISLMVAAVITSVGIGWRVGDIIRDNGDGTLEFEQTTASRIQPLLLQVGLLLTTAAGLFALFARSPLP